MNTPIVDQVVEQLKDLPEELQRRVLEFTRTLTSPTLQGVPGKNLLGFAGFISPEDLEVMREAVDRDCERVDTDEW